MLRRIMHQWERKLSTVDKNRETQPFDWGFEFLNHGFVPDADPKNSILRFNQTVVGESREFFAPSEIKSYELEGDVLRFESSIRSPYEQNNLVRCRLFPSKSRSRAVIVLPQWNANPQGHVGLCQLLAKLGITALRLTLPYHEERNPLNGPRAEYLVSSNIGRTIQGVQQAVQDARSAAEWLEREGYERIGIMGTSIGSCISFLAFVHDERFRVGVFNHVSSYFGDVVWNGITTRHIRVALEDVFNPEELRDAWAVISPNSYVARLKDSQRKSLLISAKYDLTFTPELSRLLFEEHDRWSIPYDVSFLPCGHYSSALTPFKHRIGYLVSTYFRKHL